MHLWRQYTSDVSRKSERALGQMFAAPATTELECHRMQKLRPRRARFFYLFSFQSEKCNFAAHNGNAQFDFRCIHTRHGSFCARQRVTLFVFCRISRLSFRGGGGGGRRWRGERETRRMRGGAHTLDMARRPIIPIRTRAQSLTMPRRTPNAFVIPFLSTIH